MKTVATINGLRQCLERHRLQQQTVGLVPTMGNLHQGHLALVNTAVTHCDIVVASIFVNPLQFGPNEDLANYPRTPESDAHKLRQAGCDYLFTPSATEMYGQQAAGAHCTVQVPGLSRRLCGASRPGHFDGVTTVVSKLLNIVQPDTAYFGLKDYQQFVIIRRMVEELCYAVDVIGVETAREDNGLAMSSRNRYLNSQQRSIAANLYRILQSTAGTLRQGLTSIAEMERQGLEQLSSVGMKPDYLVICNARTLEPADSNTTAFAIPAAVYVGTARLIDNVRFSLPEPLSATLFTGGQGKE